MCLVNWTFTESYFGGGAFVGFALLHDISRIPHSDLGTRLVKPVTWSCSFVPVSQARLEPLRYLLKLVIIIASIEVSPTNTLAHPSTFLARRVRGLGTSLQTRQKAFRDNDLWSLWSHTPYKSHNFDPSSCGDETSYRLPDVSTLRWNKSILCWA